MSSGGKRHVLICHGSAQEPLGRRIDELLCEKDIRTYFCVDGDVNDMIATGVENAAFFVVVPSSDFQSSSICMKAVCYADQCKIPFLCVDDALGSWVPSSWLGAILAAVQHCNAETIALDLAKMCSNLAEIQGREIVDAAAVSAVTRRPNPSNNSDLFSGGPVKGWYHDAYLGTNEPMEFDYFKLTGGTVMGQGGDSVGPFTMRGAYSATSIPREYSISWTKQYIGKHAVTYNGLLQAQEFGGFSISGEHNYGGQFGVSGGEMQVAIADIPEGDDGSASDMYWTIVLVHAKADTEICKVLRDSLTAVGISEDENIKSVAVIRPSEELNSMLRSCARADVIVPIMSAALEADDVAMRALVWCENSNKKIVPAKLMTGGYQQKGWLGAMTAGMLWFDVSISEEALSSRDTSLAEMNPKAVLLLEEAKKHTEKETVTSTLIEDGCKVSGWYYDRVPQARCNMEFEFFALMDGLVTGQGEDVVEKFVISGTYTFNFDSKSGNINFIKSYVGTRTHKVSYSGTIKGDLKQGIIIKGSHNYGGDFELHASKSGNEGHVMLSYQWNSQQTVKNIASMLKSRGIKIWFDIDGNMSGNINVAMADGVENAKCIISFNTLSYAKSANCKKELGYASALSKPIIPVNLEPETFDYAASESSEHYWVAKICNERAVTTPLFLARSERSHIESISEQLCEIVDNIAGAPVAPSPKAGEFDSVMHFTGGPVNGWYIDLSDGKKHEMKFEYFILKDGSVRGQGDDVVSPFVVTGAYSTDAHNATRVSFKKQYVGRYSHAVLYEGTVSNSTISGMHNYGGAFLLESAV